MPTYEYKCKSCGHEFEEFQSITAEPLKKCPECSKEVVRLIGSGSGIIFKGAGFYATDYRKGNKSDNKKAAQETGGATCPSAGSSAACSGCPGGQAK